MLSHNDRGVGHWELRMSQSSRSLSFSRWWRYHVSFKVSALASTNQTFSFVTFITCLVTCPKQHSRDPKGLPICALPGYTTTIQEQLTCLGQGDDNPPILKVTAMTDGWWLIKRTLCQILRTNTEILLIASSLYQRPNRDQVNTANLNESELLVIHLTKVLLWSWLASQKCVRKTIVNRCNMTVWALGTWQLSVEGGVSGQICGKFTKFL